jgi:site-specific recombinase XerD
MVLGGMRRCEVLGLRFEDLHVGQRRMFIGKGKSGHQRIVPVSARFFTAAAAYLEAERPAGIATDRMFVSLKDAVAGNHFRLTASMKSCPARNAALVWRTRHVTS